MTHCSTKDYRVTVPSKQSTRSKREYYKMRLIFSALVNYLRPRGDDDFVDRLNYYYTSMMLLLAAILVSTKQYMGKPLQCWVPHQFNTPMEQYIESYCWIQNTYYVPMHIHIPDDITARDERQIGYYQWVPFILVFEALMFCVPCLLWRLANWQTGLNLNALISSASDISQLDFDQRSRAIRTVAQNLQDLIDLQCGVRFRQKGLLYWLNWYRYSGCFMTVLYLFIKCIYTLNVVLQFFMLNAFLKSSQYSVYGFQVLYDLWNGLEWSESGHFPRVTLCDFEVRFVGNLNRYTVQCTLLINLFNEKVFAIVWCWLLLLAAITCASCLFWLITGGLGFQRVNFVLKYLHIAAATQQMTTPQSKYRSIYTATPFIYHKFVENHLRTDGVFILRMLSNHVGDVIIIDVIRCLWKEFRLRHVEDFEQATDIESKQTVVTRDGTRVILRHSCPPIREVPETVVSFNNNVGYFESKSLSQP